MGKLDALDYNILSMLIRDARTPYTEIAKILKISGGTVHVRMKKLEDYGVIAGSHLAVDYSELGYDIHAFIGLSLDTTEGYRDKMDALQALNEVTSVFYTSGRYQLLCQVLCQNVTHLSDVIINKIQSIEGVSHIETFLALDKTAARPAIPVDFSEPAHESMQASSTRSSTSEVKATSARKPSASTSGKVRRKNPKAGRS